MPKFSVKKPFVVVVGVIMLLVLGFVSFTRMTTDFLPNMNLPYMTIITTYPGAAPEKVGKEVTEKLEKAVGTVNGVKNVTSPNPGRFALRFWVDMPFSAKAGFTFNRSSLICDTVSMIFLIS